MVASIREFGFKIPVLARSDGEVVDGHLRLKAARKLGMTEVPVVLCDEWTPAQSLASPSKALRPCSLQEDLVNTEVKTERPGSSAPRSYRLGSGKNESPSC
jgi:hypothetical protein